MDSGLNRRTAVVSDLVGFVEVVADLMEEAVARCNLTMDYMETVTLEEQMAESLVHLLTNPEFELATYEFCPTHFQLFQSS